MENTRNILKKILSCLVKRDIDGLEKYINNNNIDINIVKEYIKDNHYLSSELNKILISYVSSHNTEKIIFILSLLDSPPNELLYATMKKNNHDIADILINQGMTFSKSIIKDLYNNNDLNFYNLKHILSIRYNDNNLDNNSNNNNSSSSIKKIYIKYNNNKKHTKLNIKNDYYKLAIKNENFDGFIILFDNDDKNINDITGTILNLVHFDENGGFTGKKFNKFINYLEDTSKPFQEMNFYYNGTFGNEDKDVYSFINENKYESIKLQINNYIKSFMNSIQVLTSTLKTDKSNFEKYIKENDSVLKKLKSKKFDILIYALENGASKEIVEYIIQNYSYKNLNYGIKMNVKDEACAEFLKVSERYNEYIKMFNNNERTLENLKYHYENLNEQLSVEPNRFKKQSKFTYHKTPLFSALSKNNFEIGDMLIDMGSNINYNNEDIIYYLYIENALNSENLKYILNHGYTVPKWEENDNKIYHWIKSFHHEYLLIYLTHLQSVSGNVQGNTIISGRLYTPVSSSEALKTFLINRKISKDKNMNVSGSEDKISVQEKNINKNNQNQLNQIIKYQYYLFSVNYENYISIIILYNFDCIKSNEDSILYKLFIAFNFNDSKYKAFMEKLSNNELIYSMENSNDLNKNNAISATTNYSLINESKFNQTINKINESFTKFDIISKRSKKYIVKNVMDIIEEGNIKKLQNFIENNYVSLNELSFCDVNSFDILIHSIQEKSSIEIIKYIISLYDNNVNYINNY
ncbi:hypothetical protein BCR32DRAFT_247642 [Anaeromyces robustus]|uniref:Uncharacterized protein n=1 Tax=Anaeromyces robustus TaxID=1754192 RepID=A0A1Y1WW89_9FUNG|nr:hypothetical protein BCR32DRAFT_247642 [Anaeromyces robustus]|eukprot:ORX77790.1 hypothetical protein BCR32DRAFT_247642 [Anaeromyces robustus]